MVAILAFGAPLFAVMYWLTLPQGVWLPVALTQFFTTVLCAVGVWCAHRAAIWVTHSGITERGFFGRTTTYSAREIGHVIILDLYQDNTLDTHRQLFVVAVDGRLLVRMRGQFWSRNSIETVVDELDVPNTRVPEPMTLHELNRARPELLYWFERRLVNRSR